MNKIRLARGTGLTVMVLQRKFVGFADDFQVVFRTVLGDFGQQLLKLGIQQLM